jgi:hypothetical protein
MIQRNATRMSHGAEAATIPAAPEYQAKARTLATSPIKATATRGATQTVITAIHINPVSSVRLELSRPSTTSASVGSQIRATHC